jgi:hypothetical protein
LCLDNDRRREQREERQQENGRTPPRQEAAHGPSLAVLTGSVIFPDLTDCSGSVQVAPGRNRVS